MGTGTHARARRVLLPPGIALAIGVLAGAAAVRMLRLTPLKLWTVTVTLPITDRRVIPATEAFATLIAAVAVTTVMLAWIAARAAARHRQQKHWADRGGAVIHGEAPAPAPSPPRASDSDIRLAWVEHGVRANEHDTETNRRDIEMIRGHLRDLNGVLTEACENTGQEMPELAPLEEPTTTWVPRVIEGEGMGAAG